MTGFRLWIINDVLRVTLRCSCGWSVSFANGTEFGPVGFAATTHARESHGDTSGPLQIEDVTPDDS